MHPTHLLLVATTVVAMALVITPAAGLVPFEHLNGDTTSVVGTVTVDASVAAKVLAQYDDTMQLDMETAAGFGFGDTAFPLVLLLNNMTDLATTPVNIIPGLCKQYYEAIVLVPFVELAANTSVKGGTAVKLYLDNAWAVAGGRLYYGMPKTLAKTNWDAADVFTAHHLEEGGPILAANMSINRGAAVSYAEFAPYMTLWTYMFDGLIIQKSSDPLTSKHFCSRMPMDWAGASFAPASFDIQIWAGAIAGLPAVSFSVPSVTAAAPNPSDLGAFFMRGVSWSLSRPMTHCM